VALYHCLYAYNGVFCSKETLARAACTLEIEKLKEPIGKQDQYAASYGGFNFFEFNADESVAVTPIILDPVTMERLESGLMLVFLGHQRATRDILVDQRARVADDEERFNNLCRMVDLTYQSRGQLLSGDLVGFARTMHESWMLKRSLSPMISNPIVDHCYEIALSNGAIGGKLLGAGGSGFLLLYAEPKDQERIRGALGNFAELDFRFDLGGTRIVFVGDRHTKRGFVQEASRRYA
jgi:D-glycero-alpha-D-manno-heptose-7-phosphate kinase